MGQKRIRRKRTAIGLGAGALSALGLALAPAIAGNGSGADPQHGPAEQPAVDLEANEPAEPDVDGYATMGEPLMGDVAYDAEEATEAEGDDEESLEPVMGRMPHSQDK